MKVRLFIIECGAFLMPKSTSSVEKYEINFNNECGVNIRVDIKKYRLF